MRLVRPQPLRAAPTAPPRLERRAARLIAALGAAAAALLVYALPGLVGSVQDRPGRVLVLLGLTVGLQMFSVPLYGRGSLSMSAVGALAAVFLLDPGTAIAIAAATALAQGIRRRAAVYKTVFDVGNYAVSTGAAALVYHVVPGPRVVVALLAGLAYTTVNNAALCSVMALAESLPLRTVWFERFHWARFHLLLFGPVALAAAVAYEHLGLTGLVAFALPPALMILSVRQYLAHTSAAVEEIRRAHDDLRRAHRDTIAALSRSMEAKDAYTGGHTERVAEIAVALASRLGYRGEELEAIEIGALLHDVGKIGVPERILHKPGPLDENEWAVMRTHPLVSDAILAELDLHAIVRECARSSHERIDGAGYPDGLAADEIPLPARIVLVADALDAVTSDRPYRPARPLPAALAEIRAHAGTQFCPRVVAALDELARTDRALLAGAADEPLRAVG